MLVDQWFVDLRAMADEALQALYEIEHLNRTSDGRNGATPLRCRLWLHKPSHRWPDPHGPYSSPCVRCDKWISFRGTQK